MNLLIQVMQQQKNTLESVQFQFGHKETLGGLARSTVNRLQSKQRNLQRVELRHGFLETLILCESKNPASTRDFVFCVLERYNLAVAQ